MGRRLADADWHAFCQAIYKGIEGEEWEELYCHNREMSRGNRSQKPSESQKAKAIWAMKAAKDRGEVCYDPARKEDILGRKKDTSWSFGKSTLKDPIMALDKALKCLETPDLGLALGSKRLVESRLDCNGPAVMWVSKFCKMWEGPSGKASDLAWTLGPVCACAQASTYWTFPGKYGPHGELFFFLIKEPVASNDVPSNAFGSAETLKACALIGSRPSGRR